MRIERDCRAHLRALGQGLFPRVSGPSAALADDHAALERHREDRSPGGRGRGRGGGGGGGVPPRHLLVRRRGGVGVVAAVADGAGEFHIHVRGVGGGHAVVRGVPRRPHPCRGPRSGPCLCPCPCLGRRGSVRGSAGSAEEAQLDHAGAGEARGEDKPYGEKGKEASRQGRRQAGREGGRQAGRGGGVKCWPGRGTCGPRRRRTLRTSRTYGKGRDEREGESGGGECWPGRGTAAPAAL